MNPLRRTARMAALAALATGALLIPLAPASAAPAASGTRGAAQANSGEPVAELTNEVRAGDLLRTHGTETVCPHCDAEIVTTAPGSSTPLSSGSPAGYGPADLAAIDDVPAASSSTATIAIINAGVDATLSSDLDTYRSTFGLPPCDVGNGCLRLENYDGGKQPKPQKKGTTGASYEENLAVEASMDLDMASAVGGIEMSNGSGTAWLKGGSGCEPAFPAANGQPASVTALCAGHRAASDVSGVADGVAIYDTYAPSTGQPVGWTIGGGTSAPTPYISGLYARAGNLAAVNGPNTLYTAPAADFTDITSGTNQIIFQCGDFTGVSPTLCAAGPGWDGPTGLGIPHGLGAF